MRRKSNFKSKCIRQLDLPPLDICPLGLQSASTKIELEQACSWYIASAEHNYCFWRYAETLDEPVPDRTICALLGINQTILEDTYNSAISKLIAIRDTDDMQEFKELLFEKAAKNNADNTVYLPDNFKSDTGILPEEKKDDEELPEDLLNDKKKRRLRNGMPTHRSGKRSDLYGTYSKRTLDRIKKEREEK